MNKTSEISDAMLEEWKVGMSKEMRLESRWSEIFGSIFLFDETERKVKQIKSLIGVRWSIDLSFLWWEVRIQFEKTYLMNCYGTFARRKLDPEISFSRKKMEQSENWKKKLFLRINLKIQLNINI